MLLEIHRWQLDGVATLDITFKKGVIRHLNYLPCAKPIGLKLKYSLMQTYSPASYQRANLYGCSQFDGMYRQVITADG